MSDCSCYINHAKATAPWTCPCACHDVRTTNEGSLFVEGNELTLMSCNICGALMFGGEYEVRHAQWHDRLNDGVTLPAGLERV